MGRGLVGRGLVAVGLIAYSAVVYAVVVILVGALTSTGRGGQLALTFVAAGLVAVSLEPARDRLRRRLPRSAADRLLALTSGRSQTAELGEGLEQLVRLVAESLGAGSAVRVTAELGGTLRASWQWPPEAGPATWTNSGSVLRRPIVSDSHALGALAVRTPAGRPLLPIEQRLLDDAVDHAALVVATAQMDQTLEQLVADASARYRELHRSRGRILTTMEEERRRVERDIHDGAQQHLVALAVNLRLLRVLLRPRRRASAGHGQDPAGGGAELRRDPRGAVPRPVPERPRRRRAGGGLPTCRRVQPGPRGGPGGGGPTLEPGHRAGRVLQLVEALQNAIKHANARQIVVTFSEAAGGLTFEVRDDGLGFDPAAVVAGSGTVNVRDRLAAVGGRLQVDSTPGAGTTVAGWIPAPVGAGAGLRS